MGIVAGMASETRTGRKRHRCCDIGSRAFVATGTCDLQMRAVKWIVGLPEMIEIPSLPASCAVAGFAFPAKCAFVNVVAIVALGTNGGRVLVGGRAMACLALGARVRSGKLEFRFVVVIKYTCPFLLAVAGFTFIAQLPFVRVILAMTGQTIHRQGFGSIFDVERAGMACATFGDGMRMPEGIASRLGVIENGWFPPLVAVARLACLAELAIVAIVVVFAMAIDACRRKFFFESLRVTVAAHGNLMLVEQGKFSIAIVIKVGIGPPTFLMANVAFVAQRTLVDVVLHMARVATRRQFFGVERSAVAGFAFCGGMFAQ